MLVCILVTVLGTVHQDFQILDQSALKEIKEHGFSESIEDIRKAIDSAFDNEDRQLVSAIYCYTFGMCQTDLFADQFTARFSNLHEGVFKAEISTLYLLTLSCSPRILCSKYGCSAYNLALEIFASTRPNSSSKSAFEIIEPLSEATNISFRDLLVKIALVRPVNAKDMFASKGFSKMLQAQCATLTPEMAFYICQRYREQASFQTIKTCFEEKAGPLLSGEKQSEISLENLLQELDKGIAEYGRLICEKYKNVEPGPYVPPKVPPSRSIMSPQEPLI